MRQPASLKKPRIVIPGGIGDLKAYKIQQGKPIEIFRVVLESLPSVYRLDGAAARLPESAYPDAWLQSSRYATVSIYGLPHPISLQFVQNLDTTMKLRFHYLSLRTSASHHKTL